MATMPPTSRRAPVTRSKAEARFHELVDELKLLTVAFPHLRDAYDPEDLPVNFLLKRGADRAAKRAKRPATKRGVRTTAGTRNRKA
jgi:hypothetical protein